MNDEKKLVGYVDLTPTWVGLLPLYLTAYADGSPTAQSASRSELERMAALADAYVALTKKAADQ